MAEMTAYVVPGWQLSEDGESYEGVLHDQDDECVWACGHEHYTREESSAPDMDQSSPLTSALTCARLEMAARAAR